MGVEAVLSKVEVITKGNTIKIEPNVKKFYQKEGQWFAVVQLIINGSITSMHVALGK